MAEAYITLFPGGTEDQFNALIAEMGTGHTDQPDRILFAAGPADGGWQIVQVWEKPEGLERLAEEHLRPAMARIAGRGFPNPPTMVRFEVSHLMPPGSAR